MSTAMLFLIHRVSAWIQFSDCALDSKLCLTIHRNKDDNLLYLEILPIYNTFHVEKGSWDAGGIEHRAHQ